jgi:membrane-associated phospholipid phosphatase
MQLFDTQFNILIQNLGPGFEPFMQFISFLGTEFFLLLLISTIYWCINPSLGIRMGIALMTTSCLNSFLKIVFHSPRPYWVDSRVIPYSNEPSFGFPSGHSQKAAATWGVIGHAIHRPTAILGAVLLIFMIGISRIYLGVHFSVDVLAGWIIGGIIFLLILKLEKSFTHWLNQKTSGQIFLVLASFGLGLLIFGWIAQTNISNLPIPQDWVQLSERSGKSIHPISLQDLYSGVGIWTGLSAGYCWLRYLENKYGKYHIQGTVTQKFWRFTVGLIGIIIIYASLGLIFPQGESAFEIFLRLLRHGLLGFWISGLAPIVFFKTGLLSPATSTAT